MKWQKADNAYTASSCQLCTVINQQRTPEHLLPLLLKISNLLSSHSPVLQVNTFGSPPAEEGSEWKDGDEFGPEVNPQYPFCALSVQSCCPLVSERRGLQIREIPNHTSLHTNDLSIYCSILHMYYPAYSGH